MKAKQDKCVNSTVLMENRGTPSSSRGTLMPSTIPRRRSPRLACVTPTTPVFSNHSMLRRSKTQSTMTMAPPLSTRLTPSRSTPKLTMSKHPRPFLV